MLTRLASLFWNSEERRLRALWRIAVLLTLWYNVQLVVSLLPVRTHFYVVVISLIILLGASALLTDRRSPRDYGLRFDRNTLPDLFFGLLWGGILVSGIVTVESYLGWITFVSGAWTRFPSGDIPCALISVTLFYIGISLNEEAVFRGYLLPNLAEGLSFTGKPLLQAGFATIVSGALFGLIHFDNPFANILSGVNLILYGFLLAVPFLLTGSLAITVGLHFTWNLFIGVIYGLPVSGYPPLVALMRAVQLGPERWTGGEFGPEGGLLVTLALIFELAGFLVWVRATRGRIALAEGFGAYQPFRVFSLTPGEIRQERAAFHDE
ncbi:MAG: type II CAAX endopeptidase family protein [bacterium]